MRKMIFILWCGLAGLSSRAQQTIVHDANAELRPVKGYHGVEVSNAIDLYLTKGNEETVAVSAGNLKLRDRIVTEGVDGILRIRLDGKSWSLGNTKLKAYVSFTALDLVKASGASDVYVDGVIAGDQLSLSLSGASDFKGAVKVGSLLLDQSGASDAHITGVVLGKTTIRSSGASDVKGYDLVTDDCDVHASGASDIRITINKELSADVSGASSGYFRGAGVIRESHSSGASNVKKVS